MLLKPSCEEIYQEMLGEVYNARTLDLAPTSRIAYCFKLCVEYWSRVKEMVKQQQFANEDEEIWFFKCMKPRFTAQIEYYTMVYHAELFMPSLRDQDTHIFWKKENDKINRFYKQNAGFCDYYKTGCTSMDRVYFLRSSFRGHVNSINKLYDTDSEMITSHGHLATVLLAYDLYTDYIAQQAHKVAG